MATTRNRNRRTTLTGIPGGRINAVVHTLRDINKPITQLARMYGLNDQLCIKNFGWMSDGQFVWNVELTMKNGKTITSYTHANFDVALAHVISDGESFLQAQYGIVKNYAEAPTLQAVGT